MRAIIVGSGQCVIDIALQYYGTLKAAETVRVDNGLARDAALSAGQQLLIREKGMDGISYIDDFVLAGYKNKARSEDLPYEVNSKIPGPEVPPVIIENLPSFYGAGAAGLSGEQMLALTLFYATSALAANLPFTANMQRLWYVYPAEYGALTHAWQTGNFDAISSFEQIAVDLTINGNDVPYLAYRLKYDTLLTSVDNLKITFQ